MRKPSRLTIIAKHRLNDKKFKATLPVYVKPWKPEFTAAELESIHNCETKRERELTVRSLRKKYLELK